MPTNEMQSYYDMFNRKFNKCHSKKDYRKLCKAMLKQLEVIDGVDIKQQELFSQLLGTDVYLKILALSIKMYILDQQGIPYDTIMLEHSIDDLDI